ncbi:coniferyl-alcohol dehydrogenase [uncultured Sphingomonas sp.]|uniref:coniferyl-alcohol dehydrogenase n=1 Tax=uncultured Sphingomonas sp. TaxID=158754 RepID=UPI00260DAF50|nr:coniferyl-alcohol dehydrogenase [uncultured Sphingomonas sp.]
MLNAGGAFDYRGRRVIVTGCASGIGAATAALLVALGAEVYGLDRRPTAGLAGFQTIDLSDPGSIAGVALPESIDALFNCAGLAPTQEADAIIRVNFLGTRDLTNRVAARMRAGGAIVGTASNGGLGWAARLEDHRGFIATDGFDAGWDWYDAHRDTVTNAYAFAKEALTVWTFEAAQRLIARGIRVNCTSPGAVATPMLAEIEGRVPAAAINATTRPIGRRATPEEQAWPLLWLNSPAASYINGVNLPVDGGFAAARSLGGR